MSFVRLLFDTSDFPPRWHCGNWSEWHGWSHIIADVATGAAYFTIPILLLYFVTRRQNFPFPRTFWLFCVFIFSCGLVHMTEAALFWWPAYRLSASLKIVTAIASWLTVLAIIPILPRALRLPDVGALNLQLKKETIGRHDAEEHFRIAVEAAPNAMIMSDAQGKIVLVNRCAEQLFHYDRSELYGQTVELLVPRRYIENHIHYRQQYMIAPSIRAMGRGRELFGRRKDGSEFPVEVGLNPIDTAQGAMVLGVVVDITERQLAERNRDKHRQESEEFLHIVRHDLKRPLVTVQWNLNIVLDECSKLLGSEHGAYIQTALQECVRMQEMISELGDLSKIENSPVQYEKVILPDFLAEVLRMFNARLEEKTVQVQIIAPGAEVILSTLHVREALENLIENALHYGCTDPTPRLTIQATLEEHRLLIGVADNGPGIALQHHVRIFQLFERLEDQHSKVAGSGIGLTAVHRLMQRIGGTVSIRSDVGGGAEFTLSIPLGVRLATLR
ncbi:MAG: Adaptive-response sensory-kinase SasA [Phycisphaerae bacterium]|nr:Adaptive-response sensory-kinase SasA [Phycisphaerae bacterium]